LIRKNSIVSSPIINQEGSVTVTFSQEQWRLIKIACKNYSSKLESAQKHYHKYKQLKGKQEIAQETPCMQITSKIANLQAKPLQNEICPIKKQVDTNIPNVD